MNWLTRLFRREATLVGQRAHAWHWGPHGRCEIEGEVVDEDETSYYIDISRPEIYKFRAWRRVWKRDARLIGEALPVDESSVD